MQMKVVLVPLVPAKTPNTSQNLKREPLMSNPNYRTKTRVLKLPTVPCIQGG